MARCASTLVLRIYKQLAAHANAHSRSASGSAAEAVGGAAAAAGGVDLPRDPSLRRAVSHGDAHSLESSLASSFTASTAPPRGGGGGDAAGRALPPPAPTAAERAGHGGGGAPHPQSQSSSDIPREWTVPVYDPSAILGWGLDSTTLIAGSLEDLRLTTDIVDRASARFRKVRGHVCVRGGGGGLLLLLLLLLLRLHLNV